ncbi:trehalase-like domain-containing protein [Streptomyces sp. SM5]|uniref:trehalase-like domain-containing protein n=1 Tax=unclassified Streptomyces TaxID=2593676 RepID=UPI0026B44AE6
MTRLPRIEQYGLIGDMQTSAHVCDDGSIDWLCLPRFDSPAVFAGLLGTQTHGFWQIAPAPSAGRSDAGVVSERRYRGDSLVLESLWRTPSGSVRVLDFMPPRDGVPQVIRIVEGVAGEVPSFWLVDALALTGRLGEAHARFERLLALRNDLGLLAEEYDTIQQRQLGNFPQAFSHMGLIQSALLLQQLATQSSPHRGAVTIPACGPQQNHNATTSQHAQPPLFH